MSLWTEEELELVRENFLAGLQVNQIKANLANSGFMRSLEAIKKRCRPLREEVSNEAVKFIDSLKKESEKYLVKIPIRNAADSSLLVHLSDTHFGKVVKDLNGNVLFNSEIAKTRMAYVFDEAITIARDRDIKNIVVILGGDMIENELIFE